MKFGTYFQTRKDVQSGRTMLRRGRAALLAAALGTGMLTTGCGMIHEDLDPCAVRPATRTYVSFVYDYNTQEKDLLAEHIGAVSLFVFDEQGQLVAMEERSNDANQQALKQPGFNIPFDESRLQPGRNYRIYAVAHEHPGGYSELLKEAAAIYRRNVTGDAFNFADFELTLDRDENGRVDHGGKMLNGLWTSRSEVTAQIPEVVDPQEGDPQEPDHEIFATVPLQRITNQLTIRFWQPDWHDYVTPDNYEISVVMPKGNGHITIDGKVMDDTPMTYTAHNVVAETIDTRAGSMKCIRADIGLSRLILEHDATLVVRDKTTGTVTTIPNLHAILAKNNEAYAAKNWSAQEYLDREYQYSIEFPLDGSIPTYVSLRIDALSWVKRIQLVDL